IIYPFKGNLITSDETRFDRFNELLAAHPELGIGSATNSWTNSACRSMKRVLKFKFIRAIDVPMLIIASGSDQIVSTPSIEKITPKMRAGHHIVIRNARHEIMLERDELREQFWAAFDAFIPADYSED
ncbi:MAG: alpha/beta hydrolase, partial [Hyphomicrobiales bacterium]